MSQVIVFPRGQLSDSDRKSMREVGIIAVEADDPKQVVVTVPSPPLVCADDLLMSALVGIKADPYDKANAAFAGELLKRLQAKEGRHE